MFPTNTSEKIERKGPNHEVRTSKQAKYLTLPCRLYTLKKKMTTPKQ